MASSQRDIVRRTLSLARHEASKLGSNTLDSTHLLLGICRMADEVVDELLRRHGLTTEVIREQVGGERAAAGPITIANSLPLSDNCQRSLKAAEEEGRFALAGASTCACLLLGLMRQTGSRGAAILEHHGLRLDEARRELRDVQLTRDATSEKQDLPLLKRFGLDLTEIAASDGFDPLIGRQNELSQVMRILCQRLKPNPVLVGDPGVGKTALVQGLAQRIVDGEAPVPLRNKSVVALDLSAMIAGTKFRGEFEDRLQGVLAEIHRAPDHIIFLDEIHTLVGTGAAEGSLDAANMMKPALSRGEISVIGATTVKEYRRYIEPDRALSRRFQPVHLEPPSRDEALSILQGVCRCYADFHQVRYEPDALRAAVDQTVRYIPDRCLPDKAIEVLDQAGARVKLGHLAREYPVEAPPVVTRDDVDHAIAVSTGIPISRLRAEEAERLQQMEGTLGRQVVGQGRAVQALSRAIRRSRLGVRDPRRPVGTFLLVGPPGVGKTELGRRTAEFLFDGEEALLRFDMSEYVERHAVAKLIGAPPGYVGFEDGGALTEAVRRRPYSAILFDEIEKANPAIFNILLQISEEGCLTDGQGERIDFRHAVILLTSNVGSRHFIEEGGIGFTKEMAEDRHRRVQGELQRELKRAFPPELLNRLDEVIVFEPLSQDDLSAILDLLLARLDSLFQDRDLRVDVTPEARSWLLGKAEVDATSGARPLRRAVERWIQDAISEELVQRHGESVDTIRVEVAEGELKLEVSPGKDHPAELSASGEKTSSTHLTDPDIDEQLGEPTRHGRS